MQSRPVGGHNWGMTTRRKTVEDHAHKAQEFLEHSDQRFAAGDEAQGSEKLWGAASQAVMAVAKQSGWRYGKSNARRAAVDRLAEDANDPTLPSLYAIAETFHASFYHEFMDDDVLENQRPMVHQFVHRLLAVVDGPG